MLCKFFLLICLIFGIQCVKFTPVCTFDSGTITEDFYEVASINNPNSILVFGLTSLSPGDVVLLVQMQDGTINTATNNNYGKGDGTGRGYISSGAAGEYEFHVVSTIAGVDDTTVTFEQDMNVTFSVSASARVQLITIPYCGTSIISSDISVIPWNGETGGVIALLTHEIVIDGNINVKGKGFRGGEDMTLSASGGEAVSGVQNNYADDTCHLENQLRNNAPKGEGFIGSPEINGATTTYPDGNDCARGSPGNAGGGGNYRDTGGGGGSNAGKGGYGRWFDNGNPETLSGVGANEAPYDPTHLFLGGGGGAGFKNGNVGTKSYGRDGGGIVYIHVKNSVIYNSGSIISDAEDGLITNIVDGGGGGGAGGSIVIVSDSDNGTFWTNVDVFANGGDGTSVQVVHGGGGGGGGGYILTSSSSIVNVAVSAGQFGSGGSNGEDGTDGDVEYNFDSKTLQSEYILNSISPSSSNTPTPTNSPTSSVTGSISRSNTVSISHSITPSLSKSSTRTPTKTSSISGTVTLSSSATRTMTKTSSLTPSNTGTHSSSITSSASATPSRTSSKSSSHSRTGSRSLTPTSTPSGTITESSSPSTSITPSSQIEENIAGPPPSITILNSVSNSPSKTNTPQSPTSSYSPLVEASKSPAKPTQTSQVLLQSQLVSTGGDVVGSVTVIQNQESTQPEEQYNLVSTEIQDFIPPIDTEIKSAVVDIIAVNEYGVEIIFKDEAEVCLEVEDTSIAKHSCLGYFDEDSQEWVCEDPCLKQEGNTLCGSTNHFTSFAVLFSGIQGDCSNNNGEQYIFEEGWQDSLLILGCTLIIFTLALLVITATRTSLGARLFLGSEAVRLSGLRRVNVERLTASSGASSFSGSAV